MIGKGGMGLGDVWDPSYNSGDSSTSLSYCSMFPSACMGGGGGNPGGTTGSAVSSTNIFDAIMAGVNASSKILSTRYAVPQLNPGQYIQTGPGGSVQYQLAPGQSTGFPGLSTLGAGGSSGLLLLGGGALLLIMMVSGGHK